MIQKTDFVFEVLIHDDASTDGTANIIREYEAKYPDIIKPIYQTENQFSKGVGVTRVYQFPRAKGKYIAMCEGDDYWTDPLKLQKQVDFLEANEEYGLVHSSFVVVNENGNEIKHKYYEKVKKEANKEYAFFEMLANGLRIMTLTTCFRRSLMSSTTDWFCYDYWLFLDVARKAKIHYIDEDMGCYRVHQVSLIRSNHSYVTIRRPLVLTDMFKRYFKFKEENYENDDKKIGLAFGVCFRSQLRKFKGKIFVSYLKILLYHPWLFKYIFYSSKKALGILMRK
jgi:glycosyltransferase involved in cell wall biosynthesis